MYFEISSVYCAELIYENFILKIKKTNFTNLYNLLKYKLFRNILKLYKYQKPQKNKFEAF